IYLPVTLLSPTLALAVTEAELIDYPGLNLEKQKHKRAFSALMARAPKTVDASNRRYAFVEERHPYLVQTHGRRTYPWRICMMADTPAALYENDLPYLLSRPPSGDFRWVQAGRVAWEWWNAWGLEDTPFTPGVNTATYKAYIDFAATYHLPYVILDEGWAQDLDVTQIIPEIDLPELIAYANARHVKLILWSSWPQLIDRQESLFRHSAAMGIAGFKIDFFDRDDCAIAQMLLTTAEIAAKYHLVLAYHGIHKPTGLSHSYPNVLTYEGVFGLENTKWTSNVVNFVQNDVRLAFARLLAGPMDYTPGAMTNRHRADYRKDYNHPMSMGTRCHQAAMFVVYDTGLQMLCDSPTAYAKEPAYTHFLSDLPLLWDETIALPYSHPEGCLAVLRRKGKRFVFAVLNNDQARIVTLPIWRLPQGHYRVTALIDGDNVHQNASDYKFKDHHLSPGETIDIPIAAGGGCVVLIDGFKP
ncbi:MAG: glycoside hydrolase family 97 catalytic domain-containing protein, partial [bacterium]|nr:glycoside hydrolase family 97 catalytic domain-containing protein [bacterium]